MVNATHRVANTLEVFMQRFRNSRKFDDQTLAEVPVNTDTVYPKRQSALSGAWSIHREGRRQRSWQPQRAAAEAYFLRNLSTRPAVSTIFCLPV